MNDDSAVVELTRRCIGMQNWAQLAHIAHYLLECSSVPGDVCEFGCNQGHTAALMAALSVKPVWLYDSFEGLPAKSAADVTYPSFEQGIMKCQPSDVVNVFLEAKLPLPKIIKGFFCDVQPSDLPATIAFAHLDGDFYQSIMDSLHLVWPRLSAGGIIMVHDYGWEGLQGVAPAVLDFLGTVKGFRIKSLTGYSGEPSCQAVIQKSKSEGV